MTMQRHTEIPAKGMSPDIAWVNIKEASQITGRSINSLNILVNRHRIDKVKKINGKWHIHQDSLVPLCQPTTATYSDIVPTMSGATYSDIATPSIPLEHYEKKRTEWDMERDKLQTGLMMYRYKFEEMERQMRLLPAPVEVVTSKLTELERREEDLLTARQVITDLEAELQVTRSTLESERSRNWWQRLWRK